MKKERSAGAVIFYKNKDDIEYLLLKYPQGHWEFARGHVESGEDDEQAAKREVFEETGFKKMDFIHDFKEVVSWKIKSKENVVKDVVFFLAESKSKNIKISDEHKGHIWLGYKEALKRITFDAGRSILSKANLILNNQ